MLLAQQWETGGIDLLCKWFLDLSTLKHQFVFHHSPQPNITMLAGLGAGKTLAAALSLFSNAFLIPHFKGLNTSITSGQAELAFNMLEPRIKDNRKVEPYITDILQRPYPTIKFKNGSELVFRTAGYQARNIRGYEYDCVNFDEGGYERSSYTFQVLRGRLRGVRPDGTSRMNRLSITTTPTDMPWLVDRWNLGHPTDGERFEPRRYCSLRCTTYDNTFLTLEQIEEIVADYTDSMIEQEIMAQFPDYGDTEFSRSSIEQCEAVLMNDEMEMATRNVDGDPHWRPKKGWEVREHPRHGIVYWHIAPDPGRRYIMAGDPGSSSPPKRNAGVVMVCDVTTKPYELVFLHWVDGRGSILPFLRSYKYAMDVYQPVFCGLDATGPQKGMEELAFEDQGIHVDRINFQKDKDQMVNSLKYALTKSLFRFPFIKGLHEQLRRYRREEDKKMAQDTVATFMQIAHLTRFLPSEEVPLGPQGQVKRAPRNQRTGRTRSPGGRGGKSLRVN